MNRLTPVLALAAGAALALPATAGDVITTWDSGTLDGWSFTPDATTGDWELFNSGGNPGGYVSFIDGTDPASIPNFLFAPSDYLGDYSSFGAGASFEFDGIWEASHAVINAPVIRLFGAGGEVAEGIALGLNTSSWDSFSIAIEESAWTMVAGNWNDLIQDVTAVGIHGDNGSGLGREGGVDNFALRVPAPASAGILALSAFAAARRRRA